jgi:hypothetical protein
MSAGIVTHDFHTFSRGDIVEYTYIKACEKKEGLQPGESVEATVYGVAVHEADPGTSGDQGHKVCHLGKP